MLTGWDAVLRNPTERTSDWVPSRTVGTVLMIDDNEVLRSAASKLLRTQGFRVIEADCGVGLQPHPLNLKFKTCDGLLAFAGPLEIYLLQGKVI
jgi:hypothetical protein